jgi:hypothetical protein
MRIPSNLSIVNDSSLDISITNYDKMKEEGIKFNWTITFFEKKMLKMQLRFKDPNLVSSSKVN